MNLPAPMQEAGVNECPNSYFAGRALSLLNEWHRWTMTGVLPYGCARVEEMPQYMCEAWQICNGVAKATSDVKARRSELLMHDALRRLTGGS